MLWWRAGWLAALLAAAAGVAARGGAGQGTALACLALAAAPAVLDLVLRSGSARPLVSPIAWLAGFGAAVLLSGGALGPLGLWLLVPPLSALIAGGASASVFSAAGMVALAGLGVLRSLLAREPGFDPALSSLLQIVALVTVVAAAAGALVWRQTRDERRERLLDTDLRKVADALSRQPGLLLDLGGDGRILAAYGAPAAGLRLVGHRLRDLVAPQGRPALAEAIARTLAEGQTTLSLTPADDAQGCLDLVLRRGADGRMGALVLDGAARRDREAELEAARQEAEAQNTGKSRFLANMSHELRTPLNAIMGFSDIMRSALFGPLPDRYGEYAQLIHESGEHLLELINDVLDMSKIEADRFELSREEFDAREAINAVLRLMRGQADRAGVQLRGVLPREPLEVNADRRALKQIALNLVSNALKFTPRGGAVTVGLQGVAERMELVVADTGVGMSPEDLARVGRPYEQAGDAERRAAGTGLGLSLVRSFAELHQGEMFIESVQGEGTTVTVRLPVLLEPAPGAGQPRGREVSASPAE